MSFTPYGVHHESIRHRAFTEARHHRAEQRREQAALRQAAHENRRPQ